MLKRPSDTICEDSSTHDPPNESSDLVSTVRRRRLAATALAVTAGLTLGGCGTGFNAQTNQVYQAGVGANHRGEMDVLNTLLVANDDKSATLSAAIVNNSGSEQSLSSVTVTTLTDEKLTVRDATSPVQLPQDALSPVGATEAGGFRVTDGATAGSYVKVTLTFSDAAPVTIQAPVVARTAQYAGVAGTAPADPAEDAAAGAASE